MDQMTMKFTNLFHRKKLRNLTKLGFLVWKDTIWQLCYGWIIYPRHHEDFEILALFFLKMMSSFPKSQTKVALEQQTTVQ
jgi:hypothetical protein